jgi:hypothetical protein
VAVKVQHRLSFHVKTVGSVFEILHARMRHCLGESVIRSASSGKKLTQAEHCRSNESSPKVEVTRATRLLQLESSSVRKRLLIPTLVLTKNQVSIEGYQPTGQNRLIALS